MEFSTIYLYSLLIAGGITLILLFFGDMIGLDALEEGIPFFNPVLFLSFISFLSASGFILETLNVSSIITLIASLLISSILTFLLNVFILIPLKSAEVSLAYHETSLGGQVGKVITPIPEGGFGEIVIETVNGLISKSATGYSNEFIDYDRKVLVIDIIDGIAHVKEYEPLNIDI